MAIRVSGGVLGGRRIDVPKGDHVRPTQDMVRQALFSALAALLPDSRFLDLFAGSGAVGLEAWSRGAARVTWVERDPRTLAVLRGNVAALCRPEAGTAGETEIVGMEALRWLERGNAAAPYDLIFADPPYDRERTENWPQRLAGALAAGAWLAPGARFIFEQAASVPEAIPHAWTTVSARRYGETRLYILIRSA